jgi:diaminopimelate epimerase
MAKEPEVRGRPFWKMTGSGNDFVFLDGRISGVSVLETPQQIAALCSRNSGVGADGVVVIEPHATEQFSIRYFNRDGSRGELCGNASLCSSELAVRLGMASPVGFRFSTDVGVISGRMVGGLPEIDLQSAAGLREDAGIGLEAGETRMGFVNTGVPHLVVLVGDADGVDLMRRGGELRHHASLAAGANVNFVSSRPDGLWRMRTYERGVEGETLACGTGSASTGILLEAWGLAKPPITIRTTSGRDVMVGVAHRDGAAWPSLRGEGRLVFAGELIDLG